MTRKSDVRLYTHVRDRSVDLLRPIFGTAGRVHKVDLEVNLCIRTGRVQGGRVSNCLADTSWLCLMGNFTRRDEMYVAGGTNEFVGSTGCAVTAYALAQSSQRDWVEKGFELSSIFGNANGRLIPPMAGGRYPSDRLCPDLRSGAQVKHLPRRRFRIFPD